jgi:hypothetical protein|nr:MAG TPA: hypothetical protein [Caudoviricetes sp.]
MKKIKITKDSFIPVINDCLFSWHKLKSNKELIEMLERLKEKDDCNLNNLLFTQLIILTTNGLHIKSGNLLYDYIYKTKNRYNLKSKIESYSNEEISKNKVLDMLVFCIKQLDICKSPIIKAFIYKNILVITLCKIGNL